MNKFNFRLTLLLGLFTLGFLFSHAAESYSVLNTFGQIKIKSSGKIIARGDVISSEDQVVFATKDAMAALFSPSKGRFTLKASPDITPSGAEFIAYVKSSISPPTKMLATRAGAILNELDFVKHFGEGRYFVLPGTSVEITAEVFPMNENSFFFLRCEWNGQEINKKLPFSGTRLELDAENILKVDDNPVPAGEMSNFRFYYMDGTTGTSRQICEFNPLFPDADWKESTTYFYDVLKKTGLKAADLSDELKKYLNEYYGFVEEAAFAELMHSLSQSHE